MIYTIDHSYRLNTLEKISSLIDNIYDISLDHKRSKNSYIREVFAHNWLYNHNLFLKHTKNTDLDPNESNFRLVCYYLIWIFFAKGD